LHAGFARLAELETTFMIAPKFASPPPLAIIPDVSNLLPGFDRIGGSPTFESALAAWVVARTSTPMHHVALRYRATEHGWTSADFHRTCDHVPRLLVVARSTSGYLFGGFTSVGFGIGADGTYKADPTAFLFTLVNPHGIAPTMLPSKSDNRHSVYQNASYGASFGSGHDLRLVANCHTSPDSYSALGHSYTDTAGHGGALFTGSGHPQKLGTIAEILAFCV
jgi:hypothetical protein